MLCASGSFWPLLLWWRHFCPKEKFGCYIRYWYQISSLACWAWTQSFEVTFILAMAVFVIILDEGHTTKAAAGFKLDDKNAKLDLFIGI